MEMSRKKNYLVYEDERNTTVVMDIILKHGIKAEAKRREESKSMFAELTEEDDCNKISELYRARVGRMRCGSIMVGNRSRELQLACYIM